MCNCRSGSNKAPPASNFSRQQFVTRSGAAIVTRSSRSPPSNSPGTYTVSRPSISGMAGRPVVQRR